MEAFKPQGFGRRAFAPAHPVSSVDTAAVSNGIPSAFHRP